MVERYLVIFLSVVLQLLIVRKWRISDECRHVEVS